MVKKYLTTLPDWIKLAVVLVLGYALYNFLKKKITIGAVNQQYVTGAGVDQVTGAAFNTQSVAELLFGTYFNDLTEDEEKAIKLINSVPLDRMRDFNTRYNTICINRAGNYHWWNFYNHIPANLVSDCQYFLEGKITQVQARLNAI